MLLSNFDHIKSSNTESSIFGNVDVTHDQTLVTDSWLFNYPHSQCCTEFAQNATLCVTAFEVTLSW